MSQTKTVTNTSFSVSHFAGLVIGPNGATIKSLKSKHQLKKCFVKDNMLILCGSAVGCAAAKSEVLQLIEEKRVENRQRMDRYAMVAGQKLIQKRQMRAEKKRLAEARLAARVKAELEPKEQTTYTYKGKFNFDSDSDEEETDEIVETPAAVPSVSKPIALIGSWTKPLTVKEDNEPKVTKNVMTTQSKPTKKIKKRWADVCDEESDYESEDDM